MILSWRRLQFHYYFPTHKFVQAGDVESFRAPGLTSGLQGSVSVHRGALLLVPQWQWISSFVFYIYYISYLAPSLFYWQSLVIPSLVFSLKHPQHTIFFQNSIPNIAFQSRQFFFLSRITQKIAYLPTQLQPFPFDFSKSHVPLPRPSPSQPFPTTHVHN